MFSTSESMIEHTWCSHLVQQASKILQQLYKKN